jgi:hypothetical protein
MNGLLLVHRILKTNKFAGSASALLLSVLILILSVAGASPALHKLLHADSGAVNHSCAVTLFAKGHISSIDLAPISVSFVPRLIAVRLVENSFVNAVSDVRLTPGRAPPSC